MAITTAEELLIEEMKEVNERLIDRSIYRNLHLDEIENALKGSHPAERAADKWSSPRS